MSKDEETTPKAADEPKDAAAPRQRKIVRRSASTRDNPAFAEPAPGEAAAAAPPDAAAPSAEKSAEGAPAGGAPAEGAAAPARRPRATFDARAPRPVRPPGEGRPARPHRSGDFRPPPARPVGARPIPGGPRAPASDDYRPPPARPVGARPVPGGPRAPASDDYRPPPARPVGARPVPGGPRAPAPPQGERRERRPRNEGPAHPPAERAAKPAEGGIKTVALARPAAAPAKPAPAAAKPQAKATPKPVPVFIPLARAGQVAPASAKPALTPKEALAAKTKAHAAKRSGPPSQGGQRAAAGAPPASAPPSSPFDPALVSTGAEGAVAALAQAGDAAVALIEAWTVASNAAAVAEAVEAEGVSGGVRKAARRALNVLRARGVQVPARARVVKLDDRAEVSVEATMLPPDGGGAVVFAVTSKEPSGRYRMAQIAIREPGGIYQAASGWLTGTMLKENKARSLGDYGVAPAPVPVEWARHRIAEARKLNATSGVVLPLGLDACRDLLEPAPEAAPPHPLAELDKALTSENVAAATGLSAMLHHEPELYTWTPDRGSLDALLQKLGERLGPEGMSDAALVESVLREEKEAATDRFFSPEVRAVIAARMRDVAISIRARKGDRAASDVLAVARAVEEAGLITSPPREIPFLVVFFEKGLELLARQSGGRLSVPVRQAPQTSEAPPA